MGCHVQGRQTLHLMCMGFGQGPWGRPDSNPLLLLCYDNVTMFPKRLVPNKVSPNKHHIFKTLLGVQDLTAIRPS